MAHTSLQMIIMLLGISTVSIQCCTMIAQMTGRLTMKQSNLTMAVLSTMNTVAAHLIHVLILQYTHAALAAAFWALWWFTGGGDDTKRRLRELKKKFEGVRRTAPVMA